jgi:hypothetical protein
MVKIVDIVFRINKNFVWKYFCWANFDERCKAIILLKNSYRWEKIEINKAANVERLGFCFENTFQFPKNSSENHYFIWFPMDICLPWSKNIGGGDSWGISIDNAALFY